MYFECTYNGDKKELYLDAYKRINNYEIRLEGQKMLNFDQRNGKWLKYFQEKGGGEMV